MWILLIIYVVLNEIHLSFCLNENVFLSAYCNAACVRGQHDFRIITETHGNLCVKNCETGRIFHDLTSDWIPVNDTDFTPKLQCKSEFELTFYWNSTESKIYILEIQNKRSNWLPVVMTTENIYTIENLVTNKEYRTRIWGLISDDNFWGPLESKWETTLQKTSAPLKTPNLTLTNIRVINHTLEISINWFPVNDDRVCFYDILWYSQSETGNPLHLIELEEFYEKSIQNLTYDTIYEIGIKSKSGSWSNESLISWTQFNTSSCYEIFKNLTICTPPPPEDVKIHEKVVNHNKGLFDVKIKWKKSEIDPDKYQIKLTRLHPNQTTTLLEIPGNDTSVEFRNVVLGYQYDVWIYAVSAKGSSKPVYLHRYLKDVHHTDTSNEQHVVLIGILLTMIAMTVISSVVIYNYYKRVKQKKAQEACVYFQGIEENENKIQENIWGIELENDCWKLDANRVILEKVLGEGAFGLVKKGCLKDVKNDTLTPVAVKMLKKTPSVDETKQFLREINIMKSVGPHPNLVSIIGCCVGESPSNSLMLIVEYCALGDLQNYLRTAWNHIASNQYTNVTDFVLKNIVVNRLYEMENGGNDVLLQSCDLISFARQISKGMEFLSGLKVLHRDLAARNVLVCQNKCVKVADFGLSRDVYRDNVYQKSGNSKVPIKWMAIESLTHQLYTTQSDVWSFGILLWEIVTLGGNPYPSIPTNKLLQFLLSGYRMEKPSNCGIELYKLMCSCWKSQPKERPTFTELRTSLDKLLETSSAATYLKLDVFSTSDLAAFYNPIED